MQILDPAERMSEEDYLQLAKLMREIAVDEAMTVSMVDGLITGALCSPVMIAPMTLLPMLLGEHGVAGEAPGFANGEQAQKFTGLFMKWWNHIATDLLPWRAGESEAPLPNPLLLPGKYARATAREWAIGFTMAMYEAHGVWSEILVRSQVLWPIYALCHDVTDAALTTNMLPDDPKSFFLTAKQSAALAAQLPDTVVNCVKFFRKQAPPLPASGPQRGPQGSGPEHRPGSGPGQVRPGGGSQHAGGRSPHSSHVQSVSGSMSSPMSPFAPTVVDSSPKVGRNSVCPCGSGKKYKQCCGAL